MNRKGYILILLFLAWPVCNLHRFFSHMDRGSYRPFLFNNEEAGLQWYLFHVGGSACYIMIFWAIWLYITGGYKKDRDILTVFGAIFINQVSDLLHYTAWQRHSTTILFLQGFVILFALLILLDRHIKQYFKNGHNR